MATKKKVIDSSKVLQAAFPVDECIALVTQAKTAFGATAPALTKLDKKHTPKPRTGSPAVITTVGRLATEHGIVIPKHPVGPMLQNVQTVQTLAPLKAAILGLLKIVDDTMLSANGQAWKSGTALYTVLRRVEGTDGALEADLAPLAEFFKTARKPSAKKGAASPTTTAARRGAVVKRRRPRRLRRRRPLRWLRLDRQQAVTPPWAPARRTAESRVVVGGAPRAGRGAGGFFYGAPSAGLTRFRLTPAPPECTPPAPPA